MSRRRRVMMEMTQEERDKDYLLDKFWVACIHWEMRDVDYEQAYYLVKETIHGEESNYNCRTSS